MDSERFWNPYLAGIALGVVLLATFLVMGRGLGASGAAHRIAVFGLDLVASAHVDRTPALASAKEHGQPLDDWLVFEVFGVFLGGAVAAYSSGRLRSSVLRGPRAAVPTRLAFALTGGLIMGIAARMARGCTSGQALTGGALLSVGSWAFMFAVFGGGYALAYLMRRQWT
jgi:uncharacterized protein